MSRMKDSNLRPPAPKAGALPGCANPRITNGTLGEIRTPDFQIRNPALCPAELRGHT